MSKEISSMWVGLTGNVSGVAGMFSAAVKPIMSVTSAIGGLNSKLGGLTKLTGIGAALSAGAHVFDKILSAPAEAFNAAKADADASAKLDAVLRATGDAAGFSGDQLRQMATDLQQVTTFGDETTVAAQSVLATFTKVRGDVFKQAIESAQDLSTILGTDLQGATVQLGKALNDPSKGYTALRRAGVSFSAEQIQQIKTMQAAGDMAGAQSIILKELQNEFGGAARAMAKTPFGRITQMWNSFGDTMEQVGYILADVSVAIFDAFDISGAVSGFAGLLTTLQGRVKSWISVAVPAVQSFGAAAFDVFGRVEPIAMNAAGALWAFAKSGFQAVYDFVAPIATSLYDVVSKNWRSIVATTVSAGASVWSVVEGAWTFLGEFTSSVWTGIVATWNWGTELITGQTGTATADIKGFFQATVDVGNWLRDTFATIFTTIGYTLTHWKDVVAVTMLGVAYNVVKLGDQIGYVFTEVIPTYLKWLAQNWSNILLDMFKFTGTVFSNLADSIVNVMSNLPGLISGSVDLADLWVPLTDGFESSMSALPEIAARKIPELEQTMGGALEATNNQLNKGLGEALAANQRTGMDAAKAVGDAFAAAVKPVPDDEAHDPFALIRRKHPILPTPEIPQIPAQTVEVKPKLGKAVLAGSGEAQALRFAGPVPVGGSAAKGANDVASKQLTEAQKQTKALQKIAANTEPEDDEEVDI